MRRWILGSVLIFLILIALLAAVAGWRLWRALPRVEGTVTAVGLRQPVEIIRDVEGIPHIRAATEADALFALGYVHAQDRLWQMEFQRRLASGQLAAILGTAALDTDRLMRTIGFGRAAEQAVSGLDAETRALIEAYVAGVNACLDTQRGSRLPVEFAILRFAPDRWRAVDVIAWQKVMGWSMSLNWREELLRVRLTARLGSDGAAALLPAYAAEGPIVVPDFMAAHPRAAEGAETQRDNFMAAHPRAAEGAETRRDNFMAAHSRAAEGVETQRDAEAALNELLARSASAFLGASDPSEARLDLFPTGGSNNWVLAGSRTASGRPLLANDPHLGTQAPGVWYVAHITGGALDVIGATLPGTPAVVIGHNGHIAWGVTNMMADVQDLFVERINERDEAEVDGGWEPMQVVHETIEVRDAPSVTVRVRISRHGPLISDLIDERAALSLRWTGHDPRDRTAAAFLRINRAQTWQAFTEAFADYHLPMLNFVYADTGGNIGYIGPGALPMRAADGRLPLPGWSRASDWVGYVSLADLPRDFNPPRGFIASANNQAVPDSYPFVVSTSWEAPYRATRISAVLESLNGATVADMQRLQTDQYSDQASVILPFLLQAAPRTDRDRSALDRLRHWNRMLGPESGDAALFKAYGAAAAERLFADDIGAALWNDYRAGPGAVAKALDGVARAGGGRWCDDVTTPAAETCAQTLGVALEEAVDDLARRYGTDPATWQWGRENQVWFPHLPFHASPLLRVFFSRSVARGGDAFTVNPSTPVRDQMLVASYRQVIDMADVDRSVFVLPLGQSGHLLSGRYGDLLDEWSEGRYRPLRFTRAAVDGTAASRLQLQPGTRRDR